MSTIPLRLDRDWTRLDTDVGEYHFDIESLFCIYAVGKPDGQMGTLRGLYAAADVCVLSIHERNSAVS